MAQTIDFYCFVLQNYANEVFINRRRNIDVGDRVITPNRAKEIIYDITTHNIDDRKTKNDIENFLNIIIPQSGEELTNSRVYEILIGFKEFLLREEV